MAALKDKGVVMAVCAMMAVCALGAVAVMPDDSYAADDIKATYSFQVYAGQQFMITIPDDWGNINNFSFGADLRINPVKNLSLDIPVTIGFGKDAFSLAAIPTINANIPIAEIVDIAVGVGTQLDFTKAGDTWTLNGLPMDEAGGALAGSKLVYRAGLTVNLGILPLGIGINAVVPGSSGFGEGDIGGIFIPMWESTRISIVALLNLF